MPWSPAARGSEHLADGTKRPQPRWSPCLSAASLQAVVGVKLERFMTEGAQPYEIRALRSAIADLNSEISKLTAAIKALGDQVKALAERIDELEASRGEQ